jgi:16S rRNA processing protein RimM
VKWDEMAAVGRIARAHGIRGQVIVSLDTDFPEERFRPGAELFI